MDKTNTNLEYLLMDPSFVRWVKYPSNEDSVYWKHWLKNHPEKEKDVEVAREIIFRMKFNESFPDQDSMDKALSAILIQYDTVYSKNKERSTFSEDTIFYYAKWAAVYLAIFISLVVVYQIHNKNISIPVEATDIVYIEKSTPEVVKTQTWLPDGTKVWLNSSSSIQFPEHFKEQRIVYLHGEAFFDVVKDTLRPFTVVTSHAEVEVLGTSFNVNAFGDLKAELISLVSGSVYVKSKNSGDIKEISPGQQIYFDLESETMELRKVNINDFVAWKDGWLIFKNAGVNEIIGKLERWYGVKIELVNRPASSWNVNGYFQDQTLETVLKRLSFSKDFEYSIKGKNVKIKFL
jgi:transmembrane sensor